MGSGPGAFGGMLEPRGRGDDRLAPGFGVRPASPVECWSERVAGTTGWLRGSVFVRRLRWNVGANVSLGRQVGSGVRCSAGAAGGMLERTCRWDDRLAPGFGVRPGPPVECWSERVAGTTGWLHGSAFGRALGSGQGVDDGRRMGPGGGGMEMPSIGASAGIRPDCWRAAWSSGSVASEGSPTRFDLAPNGRGGHRLEHGGPAFARSVGAHGLDWRLRSAAWPGRPADWWWRRAVGRTAAAPGQPSFPPGWSGSPRPSRCAGPRPGARGSRGGRRPGRVTPRRAPRWPRQEWSGGRGAGARRPFWRPPRPGRATLPP